jgi:hypothetical protein
MADRTHNGRSLRMTIIIDEFTRECLAIPAGMRPTAESLQECPTEIFCSRGASRSTVDRTMVPSSNHAGSDVGWGRWELGCCSLGNYASAIWRRAQASIGSGGTCGVRNGRERLERSSQPPRRRIPEHSAAN